MVAASFRALARAVGVIRPTIVHVTTRFQRGGGERNVAELMRLEQDLGFDVCLAVGPDPELTMVPQGIPVHVIPTLVREVNPIADARAILDLRGLFSRLRPVFVQTHFSKAGILGRMVRPNGTVVAHSVHMSSFGQNYSAAASAIFRNAERLAATRSTRLVFVGRELRDQYLSARVVKPEKAVVIHSPIQVDRFIARRGQRDVGQALLGTLGVAQTGEPILLAIGSLEARKRHADLIRWLAPMLVAGKIRLVIAGEGAEYTRLRALLDRMGLGGRVALVGHVEDVPTLFAGVDMLVHASLAEGVAQVGVQALAAGVPVVATEVVGFREIETRLVTIVPSDGAGFSSAVQSALESSFDAPRPDEFDSWRPATFKRRWTELIGHLYPPIVDGRCA